MISGYNALSGASNKVINPNLSISGSAVAPNTVGLYLDVPGTPMMATPSPFPASNAGYTNTSGQT